MKARPGRVSQGQGQWGPEQLSAELLGGMRAEPGRGTRVPAALGRASQACVPSDLSLVGVPQAMPSFHL